MRKKVFVLIALGGPVGILSAPPSPRGFASAPYPGHCARLTRKLSLSPRNRTRIDLHENFLSHGALDAGHSLRETALEFAAQGEPPDETSHRSIALRAALPARGARRGRRRHAVPGGGKDPAEGRQS